MTSEGKEVRGEKNYFPTFIWGSGSWNEPPLGSAELYHNGLLIQGDKLWSVMGTRLPSHHVCEFHLPLSSNTGDGKSLTAKFWLRVIYLYLNTEVELVFFCFESCGFFEAFAVVGWNKMALCKLQVVLSLHPFKVSIQSYNSTEKSYLCLVFTLMTAVASSQLWDQNLGAWQTSIIYDGCNILRTWDRYLQLSQLASN